MSTITIVYGTRPEAIKLRPVVDALRALGVEPYIICTGQHSDLLDGHALKANQTLNPPPGYNGGFISPQELIARVLERIHFPVATRVVVVQGDTSSAFAGAAAAFHARIPIAHVEAGLRTGDLAAPFPEEGYRQMIDRLAARLYAPTPRARNALLLEGRDAVLVTGNTSIDAALRSVMMGAGRAPTSGPFVLATIHRREAARERRVDAVCEALLQIAAEGTRVVMPVHPNENRVVIRHMLGGVENIDLIAPLGYDDMIAHVRTAACVVTDSGGLQEEGAILGTHVVVARQVTERAEGLSESIATLTGYNAKAIEAVRRAVRAGKHGISYVYGKGDAGKIIAADLVKFVS